MEKLPLNSTKRSRDIFSQHFGQNGFGFWESLFLRFFAYQNLARWAEHGPGLDRACAQLEPGLGQAGPGLGHLDQKMLIFYDKYWCLSSRPPVSCRRDESKCHQVCIFPDQDERRPPAHTFQGPLAIPLEPLIASSVWGTNLACEVWPSGLGFIL